MGRLGKFIVRRFKDRKGVGAKKGAHDLIVQALNEVDDNVLQRGVKGRSQKYSVAGHGPSSGVPSPLPLCTRVAEAP